MPEKNKNNKLNAAQRKERTNHIVTGCLLSIVTGVMPLAAHGIIRPIPPELWDLTVEQQRTDAFAYWRSWLLIIPALLIVLYVVSDLLTGARGDSSRKDHNHHLSTGSSPDFTSRVLAYIKNPPLAAVTVYGLFVVLSAIFSPFPYTALHGTVERFEGVFVLLAYIVIFITIMQYAHSEKQIKTVLAGVLFSSLLMGAVGLSQMLGHDFFETELGSIYLTGQTGSATPRFTLAYGMLFNPNTYGLYTSMLAPLFLLCGFTYKGNKAMNMLLLLAGALMLAGIPGSGSLGGLLGALASVAIVGVTMVAHMIYQKKWPHWIIPVAALVVIAGSTAACLLVDSLNANVRRLGEKLQTAIAAEPYTPPMDYKFDGDTVRLVGADSTLLTLTADGTEVVSSWLTVRDSAGRTVAIAAVIQDEAADNADIYQYEVPGFGTLTLTRYADYFMLDGMYLSVVDGEIIPFRQSGIPIDINAPIPAIGFKGYETWATSRGYIWSRSLPLVFQYILLGSGPDSFINVFPQDDILGKLHYLYNPYMIVDKAHNLYIQTSITTGFVSMLALVFLLGYYLITTFVSLVKSRNESLSRYGLRLGLLAAVSAFAVSSMATDSTIPSTGMFYCLLGLGYALNCHKSSLS